MSPAGEIAVVTGGGGGIGGACARQLAERGSWVVVVGRTPGTLEAVAGAIERDGGRASTFPLDVRDVDRVNELATFVDAFDMPLTALVNAAGGQFVSSALDISPRGWSAVVDTNLTGTFLVCRALFGQLHRAGAAVVNVVSNVWQRAAPKMAHSGAARAGVVSLTRTLALEWAPFGVRVNAVSPGLTDTPALRSVMPRLEDHSTVVPLGRLATVEEVAGVICFLLSSAAGYVTGEVLCVDGGLQLT